MALADNPPLINGQAYSYADIIVSVLGVPVAGITAVEYSQNQEITENYGAGRYPVSRGLGKIEHEAKINNLQNVPEFDIEVNYVPEGSTPRTDVIRNCRFKNTIGGASEGDSNVIADLELAVSHIDWNN
jgi:hypothetical protein